MLTKLGGSLRYRDDGPATALGQYGSISGTPIGGEPRATVVAALVVVARKPTRRRTEVALVVVEERGNVIRAARRLGISRQRVYQVLGTEVA